MRFSTIQNDENQKKHIPHFKSMVQNLKALGDDKAKFRQWNVKLINALSGFEPSHPD